jgi:hypothetical protein
MKQCLWYIFCSVEQWPISNNWRQAVDFQPAVFVEFWGGVCVCVCVCVVCVCRWTVFARAIALPALRATLVCQQRWNSPCWVSYACAYNLCLSCYRGSRSSNSLAICLPKRLAEFGSARPTAQIFSTGSQRQRQRQRERERGRGGEPLPERPVLRLDSLNEKDELLTLAMSILHFATVIGILHCSWEFEGRHDSTCAFLTWKAKFGLQQCWNVKLQIWLIGIAQSISPLVRSDVTMSLVETTL